MASISDDPVNTTQITELTTVDNISTFLNDFEEEIEARRLFKYFFWIQGVISLLSFVGNGIIIVIMNTRSNRGVATSMIFTALAVSDIIITIFGPFQNWFQILHGSWFFHLTKYEDPLVHITAQPPVEISSWLVILITLERVVCVTYPFKVKYVCNKTIIRISIVAIYLFFYAFNVTYILCSFHIEKNIYYSGGFGEKMYEMYSNENFPLAFEVLDIFEFIFKVGIPVIIIVPCNITIFVIFYKRKDQNRSAQTQAMRAMTIKVILICVLFLVTMLPRQIYLRLFQQIVNPGKNSDYSFVDEFLFQICDLLQNLNAALNFYIYILSGTRFRNEVKRLFRLPDKCWKNNIRNVNISSSVSEQVTTLSVRSIEV